MSLLLFSEKVVSSSFMDCSILEKLPTPLPSPRVCPGSGSLGGVMSSNHLISCHLSFSDHAITFDINTLPPLSHSSLINRKNLVKTFQFEVVVYQLMSSGSYHACYSRNVCRGAWVIPYPMTKCYPSPVDLWPPGAPKTLSQCLCFLWFWAKLRFITYHIFLFPT